MYFLTDEIMEITANNAQISIKNIKNLRKLVKMQNPVNPGFEVQKPNPNFREKPGFQTRVG